MRTWISVYSRNVKSNIWTKMFLTRSYCYCLIHLWLLWSNVGTFIILLMVILVNTVKNNIWTKMFWKDHIAIVWCTCGCFDLMLEHALMVYFGKYCQALDRGEKLDVLTDKTEELRAQVANPFDSVAFSSSIFLSHYTRFCILIYSWCFRLNHLKNREHKSDARCGFGIWK